MKTGIYFSLFVIIISLTACKKYEESPWLSFRTAEARICGKWTVENYYENGADRFKDFEGEPLYCSQYEFTDVNHASESIYTTVISGCKGPVQSGWWLLNDKNQKLSLTLRLYDNPQHPLETHSVWRILRLTKKEFWIETTFNGKTYEIHFKEA